MSFCGEWIPEWDRDVRFTCDVPVDYIASAFGVDLSISASETQATFHNIHYSKENFVKAVLLLNEFAGNFVVVKKQSSLCVMMSSKEEVRAQLIEVYEAKKEDCLKEIVQIQLQVAEFENKIKELKNK